MSVVITDVLFGSGAWDGGRALRRTTMSDTDGGESAYCPPEQGLRLPGRSTAPPTLLRLCEGALAPDATGSEALAAWAAGLVDADGLCLAAAVAGSGRMLDLSVWDEQAVGLLLPAAQPGLHSLWRLETLRLLAPCPRCEQLADLMRDQRRCPACGTAVPGPRTERSWG